MFESIVKAFVNTPVYPHWLEHRKMRQGNDVVIQKIKGNIVEVGAGDGSRKQAIMAAHTKIKSYTATDYSSWDDEFEKLGEANGVLGKLSRTFMGRHERAKFDVVCSATKLPFKEDKFDFHISFEVLEHINDPFAYFSEAARVVKSKGYVIFSVPFLYREHKMDFFRYTGGFFEMVADNNGMKLENKYSNTGYGTTMAVLTNQWIVRRVMEGPIVLRPFLLLLSPFIFIIMNVLGLLIDMKPDVRFANRYHIIMRKK
jgi:SAM-dependent methyltransferase